MTAVLLTGMSGAGVSTVLAEVGARGFPVVDTDDPGWADEVPTADGTGIEQIWREGPMSRLLTEQRDGVLVVAGAATNQGRFYDRFDAVILLSAPPAVMFERIEAREKSFGRSADERDRILSDLAAVEPLLRATATAEVRTDRPLADVVEDVLDLIRACG